MTTTLDDTDVVVVGAGIVGLAHALACARRGLRVTVVERDDRAVGASIRNFGSIWPIGQGHGDDWSDYERGCHGADVWRTVAAETGMWIADTGSLTVARHADELAVLEEFLAQGGPAVERGARLVTAAEVADLSPAVVPDEVVGGMFSPTEVNVDPTVGIPTVARWLAERHGVRFVWGALVREIDLPRVRTSAGDLRCEQVVVCSGADFQTLYPELWGPDVARKCKLQMMRTVPQPGCWDLGPTLCAGLTLLHYDSFSRLSSLGALRERMADELPFQREHGIHVLATQTASGAVTIGDSHDYAQTHDPFEKQAVFDAILDYFDGFVRLPDRRIEEYWHGVYPSLVGGAPHLVAEPEPGVRVANGLGGAGMTLSFGLAEDHLAGRVGPRPALAAATTDHA
ncbi:TIGR03364 family FAD-dependent oxidoreductase [Isoptericola cucumis]|uniref:TIGR03364 family FAD-dependent oxidoreductase n=1 Tax=Isoptericola cucumis TaxID=1776856 RepID=UPI00320824C1